MSHKKIAHNCAEAMKKDEKEYKKKIATAKKTKDLQKANHYEVEKKEAHKGSKVIGRLERSFKTD